MMILAILIAVLVVACAAFIARNRHLQRRVRPKSRYFSVTLAEPGTVDPVDKRPH